MSLETLKNLGDVHFFNTGMVFFGGVEAPPDKIQLLMPFSFSMLKQVHGDVMVKGDEQKIVEADAQWTDQENLGLFIKSADCLPLFIYSPQQQKVAAIHAGWRGVAQNIVTKSLQSLEIARDPRIQIWIGPHIQKSSFEVDAPVAEQILNAHGLTLKSGGDFFSKINEKFHVDLAALVRREMSQLGIPASHIWTSTVDTKTDPRYHSFRRGEKGVRNYGFIVRL